MLLSNFFISHFVIRKSLLCCATLYCKRFTSPNASVTRLQSRQMGLSVHVGVRVDICGCVCQPFSLRSVTLHLVIQQPHMHDYMLNTGMTQPPFDKDLVDTA